MKKGKILSMLLSMCLLVQTAFATGIMTASAAGESDGTEETVLENPYEVCKSIYNFRLVGSPVVGETLRVEYECSDPDMDTSTLNFRWIPMEKVNLAVNDSGKTVERRAIP